MKKLLILDSHNTDITKFFVPSQICACMQKWAKSYFSNISKLMKGVGVGTFAERVAQNKMVVKDFQKYTSMECFSSAQKLFSIK